MSSPRYDLPTIEDDTQPFWDAVREGRLLLRHCRACDVVHYYPRPFCPSCWSEDVDWVESAGSGTVYTFSTIFRNDLPPFPDQVPYVAAIVELDEGPRMMTRLVDVDDVEITIGMPVRAAFTELTEDIDIVVFAPA